MRERVLFVRERRSAASDKAITASAFLRRHRFLWIVVVAGTVLLAGVGAFETGGFAAQIRYPYWLFLMSTGGFTAAVGLEWIRARGLFANSVVIEAIALVAVVTAIQTPLIWLAAALLLDGSLGAGPRPDYVPQAILVATILIALQLFADRGRSSGAPSSQPSGRARETLRSFFPDGRAGATLYAVEAEDHYLRFHTDRGSTLVLMRFGDALTTLRESEGAQTHRSWWVARDAVVDASRGRGRAALRLKNGLTVPVSRTYARSLRLTGWF